MTDAVSLLFSAVVPFLILISVVITVHELGHYWVGRMFNAAAESFAVGFGKPIFEVRDKRGTRWRINWLPLGGFVKFVGELQAPTDTREPGHQGESNSADAVIAAGGAPIPVHTHDHGRKAAEAQLVGKPYTELGPWKRIAISLGGPFANFLFAIVVYAGMGMTIGVPEVRPVPVAKVLAGGAGEAAGFMVGDVIAEVGGRKVGSIVDVLRVTQLRANEEVKFRILRNGEPITLTATPREEMVYNEGLKLKEKLGRVGLELSDPGAGVRRLNPIEAVGYGISATGGALDDTLNVMRRLVTAKDGLDKLSGPIGILKMTGSVTGMHMSQKGPDLGEKLAGLAVILIQMAALLSIGVGFFNLLPVPILDGGAVVMCLAEAVSGRDVPEKVQRVGLTIGLACLALFALVITWQDILK